MIKIIDYGLGNILAFQNVYRRLNIDVAIARTADELAGATKLILPGVGAFDHAMELLNASGMRETIDEMVLEKKVPVLGVCVGMQILAHSSTEGRMPGLRWIDAIVDGFRSTPSGASLPVPHMGWNDVNVHAPSPLFAGLESRARFYFLHSYYFKCNRPGDVVAVSRYGGDFSCAVNAGNIYGVQFHPEKSHSFGTTLLKNFASL
jgi:imidazole glycerol-phosphate synthase subunit HisH